MPVIEGASVLIYQMLYNIISNSLKFSPADRRPEIDIVSTPVQMEGADAVRIDVSDNGIGFAQHAAEGIFTSFSRLNSKDKYEGTGLGLALAKRIVERHAGQISARGEPGKGAVFSILLPVHQTKTTI
jgi:signal transduction histidine kinase